MHLSPPLRPLAEPDLPTLARLHDMASGGFVARLWAAEAGNREGTGAGAGDPWQVGLARQRRRLTAPETVVIADTGSGAEAAMVAYRRPDLPVPTTGLDPALDPGLVPMVDLENLAPGSWYLDILAVLPEARGRGHARRLMDAYLAAGRAQGHRTASLIVHAPNPAAQHLYTAAGFTETARRPVLDLGVTRDFWAEDWVLMEADLSVPAA